MVLSIDLPDAAFVTESRPAAPGSDRHRLVCVGSLEQMYKSPDVVLEALAIAARRGAKLQLTWIGEGKHRQEMEGLAARYSINGGVRFMGHLPPGRAIRDELDAADLFVLASGTRAYLARWWRQWRGDFHVWGRIQVG